jgi:hypothetical protein
MATSLKFSNTLTLRDKNGRSKLKMDVRSFFLPNIDVYSEAGKRIYGQNLESLSSIDQAQISPNGKYILVMGIVDDKAVSQHNIKVIEIDNNQSVEMPFNLGEVGYPHVSVSRNGRFQIQIKGKQIILPNLE